MLFEPDGDQSSAMPPAPMIKMRLSLACLVGIVVGSAATFVYRANVSTALPAKDDIIQVSSAALPANDDIIQLSSAGESACGDRTDDETNWQDYVPNGIYVDVDTSKCGFAATPNYFTSLGGSSLHWRTTGSGEVYRPTSTGFRIYIHRADGLNAAKAKELKWYINWIGTGHPTKNIVPNKLCTGTSDISKWVDYAASSLKTIYVDVDTSQCAYKSTPIYVTSMGGRSNHWKTHGTSEVYEPTPNGFRIYIRKMDTDITPNYAKDRKWVVNWIAMGDAGDRVPCTGSTVPFSTNWKQYIEDGIYVEIDTSKCGFKTTPQYISSMGGVSNFWLTEGSTQIYEASPTGFRVYIFKKGVTPVQANSLGWYMRWMTAVTPSMVKASCASKNVCTGKTEPGAGWDDHEESVIFITVDTSKCAFKDSSTPLYFGSLGGEGTQWTTRGANAVARPGQDSFQVFLTKEGISADTASQHKWYINWIATGETTAQPTTRLCTGSTDTKSTNWLDYAASSIKSIHTAVDTSHCGFKNTPIYVTSLGGASNHWTTTGASSIYSPTSSGFHTYVRKVGLGITPAYAQQRNWHVNWVAAGVGEDSLLSVPCSGRTKPYTTNWRGYVENGIYVEVDTSMCGYTETPTYLSSLGGGGDSYSSLGGSEIYKATPSSFRVYIKHTDITPEEANNLGWYVNWLAASDSKTCAPASTPAPTALPTPAPTQNPTQKACSPPQCKLTFQKVSQSNLGGQGPDTGVAELRFDSVCDVQGQALDLVVTSLTEYTVNNKKANGLSGKYGQINVLGGTQVDLQFQFVKKGTYDLVPIASSAFTIFDMDGNKKGNAYQKVVATGYDHYTLTSDSTVATKVLSTSPPKISFTATENGDASDNPKDPMKLTTLQKRRTVSVLFSNTASFILGFGITGTYGDGGRNFVFAGKSSIDKPGCR